MHLSCIIIELRDYLLFWSNVVTSTSAGDESRCRILHRLEVPEQTVCDATEQRVTVVKMTAYKTLHERHCCIDGQ